MKGMTQEQLVQWREDMIQSAKTNIMTDGELAPVTLVMVKDPESGEVGMGVLQMDMENDMTKQLDAMRIKKICTEETVYGLMMMSEVWMAQAESKEEMESEDFVMPSQRDDKKECMMCTFESTGETKLTMFDIIRDEDGKITELKEHDASGYDGYEGRFANLLKGF